MESKPNAVDPAMLAALEKVMSFQPKGENKGEESKVPGLNK